jgi:predicted phage-related endonuclease
MATQYFDITDEAAWLDKRKGYVTSTEVAALYGLSPWRTAFELYHIKRGAIPEPELEGNFLKFGKILEEPICDMIRIDNPSWAIEAYPVFAFDDEDRIGSSFDRVVTIDGKPYLLEIKSISHSEYKNKFVEHTPEDIEASPQYEIQLQTELEVDDRFGAAIMAIFILDTRQLRYIIRERDREMGAELRKAVRQFWDLTKPPEPEWARDKSLIAKLCLGVDQNNIIDATENVEITELAAQYKAEKQLEKQSKENADTAYAKLLYAMGEARYAWTKYHKITRSSVKGSSTTVTPEMVGTQINVRSPHARLTITEL